jgi:hypothetical protein
MSGTISPAAMPSTSPAPSPSPEPAPLQLDPGPTVSNLDAELGVR